MPTLNLDDELASWSSGAMIVIHIQGDIMIRPAAFVWALPDGIEWLEPSYADPWGAASPAYHVRRGRREGFTTEAEGQIVEALPVDPENEKGLDITSPLRSFAQRLADQGTTWAEERIRARSLIDPQP